MTEQILPQQENPVGNVVSQEMFPQIQVHRHSKEIKANCQAGNRTQGSFWHHSGLANMAFKTVVKSWGLAPMSLKTANAKEEWGFVQVNLEILRGHCTRL